MRDFAKPCAVPGEAQATAEALMRAVHRALSYVPGSTNVKTTAEEALAEGRGVCQDFTHLTMTVDVTVEAA